MRQKLCSCGTATNTSAITASTPQPAKRGPRRGRMNQSPFNQPRSRISQPATKNGRKVSVRDTENAVPTAGSSPEASARMIDTTSGCRSRAM